MYRKEFLRTTPESVGISSGSVQSLIDRLESGFTEMHGIQIMRHGKICAEGWWAPYSPHLRHNLMSVTKTYTGTAIGIAYTEGLLKLTDRIVDIFPEESPKHPDAFLASLTVRDLLCMGCGMDSEPVPTRSWIRDFISTPVIYKPGTRFRYNSVSSSFLGAVITKITGQGLIEFLTPRLFHKIGIRADNLLCGKMPDGIDAGGAGLYATTEDNLRLMKLYLDGGVWEGQRILAEDYVRLATTAQIDTSGEAEMYPFAKDNFCGYGFQIWMCRPEGVYRADGAMGQFSVVSPKLDMVISVTETGRGIDGPQKTLDAIWDFLKDIGPEPLPEDPPAAAALKKRLSALALKSPARRPCSAVLPLIDGRVFDVTEGILCFENQTLASFCGLKLSSGISQFCFQFSSDSCIMYFVQDCIEYTANIALDGTRTLNDLSFQDSIATLVCMSGAWTAENVFTVTARWIETSFEKEVHFSFHDSQCVITTSDPLESVGPTGELNEPPSKAIMRRFHS